LALQTEPSYTHSHDHDGKIEHVTKENNQDPNRHEKATQLMTAVGPKQPEDPGEVRVPSTTKGI
jgi:hypothetical protein